MAIQDVDVDDIVTDEMLDEFLGGQAFRSEVKLNPESWAQTSKPARQHALDLMLESLRRRVPPITYGDLADPTELKLGILYGAAERLYQLAMSTAGFNDVYVKQRELYETKFDNEVSGFTPTLSGGLRGTSGSIGISRR